VVLVFVLSCGDGDAPKQVDAPRPIDAAIDAPPDAFACRFAADCDSATPNCCIGCSPGGACEQNPSCQSSTGNFCAHALCDPNATAPCMKPFNGGPGTCTMVRLSMFDPRMVWACK
jgi:hypothetical protein